jgi:hypothetical protein
MNNVKLREENKYGYWADLKDLKGPCFYLWLHDSVVQLLHSTSIVSLDTVNKLRMDTRNLLNLEDILRKLRNVQPWEMNVQRVWGEIIWIKFE